MGAFFETIPPSVIQWLLDQKMFWVATAPLSGAGHVNVSPKGGSSFGIIDNKTFWYLDLTGSGSETISHIYEPGNGRVTILFNAFEGPPRIVRLWGKGRVLERGSRDFQEFVLSRDVKMIPGTRSIVIVDIHQVGTSCGFSVPYYDFKEFRETLVEYHVRKEEKFKKGDEKESIERYWALKNAWSMDGLPAMHTGLVVGHEKHIVPVKKMVGPLAPENGGLKTDTKFSPAIVSIVALLSFLMGVLATLYGTGTMTVPGMKHE